jgi:hypothetical protein
VADGGQEHDGLLWDFEEAADVVVEEGQAGSAEAKGVRGQVQAAAVDGAVELCGAVGAVAETE